MSVATSQNANAERLAAACVLSIIGGFLDIYTYLCRGKVFANAVTGNMVLFGFHLANLEWGAGAKYLLAIFFYALGVFAAEYVHRLVLIAGQMQVADRKQFHSAMFPQKLFSAYCTIKRIYLKAFARAGRQIFPSVLRAT